MISRNTSVKSVLSALAVASAVGLGSAGAATAHTLRVGNTQADAVLADYSAPHTDVGLQATSNHSAVFENGSANSVVHPFANQRPESWSQPVPGHNNVFGNSDTASAVNPFANERHYAWTQHEPNQRDFSIDRANPSHTLDDDQASIVGMHLAD